MANELNLTLSLLYTKGLAVFDRSITNQITVTGTAVTHDVQNIGTTEETLALGDVSPSGFAFFRNLDGTNYVELGKATGVYAVKLKAGEWSLLRLDTWSSIFAKANTAAVDLEYMLISD